MPRFGHTLYGLLAFAAGGLAPLAGLSAQVIPQRGAEITGRVTYAGTRQGIAQALVVIPGAGLGSLTDAEGRYRLEGVPAGIHELAPTLVGCQLASRTVEVAPGQLLEVSFELSTPVINLQGIVVTALASETPEAELPFSVGRITPQPGEAASRSVGALLQGRIAGARVLFGSGQPGANPSIQLRSPQSIQRGNDPLLVVDGVITHGGISDIDPMDVEEVQVLKGAAAAAGYGSRGVSGVIEIRTRRGPSARARASGPLIIVDGTATGATLADLDPASIEDIRKLSGAAAAVLYGPRAESGVILVSTTGASPEASRPPFCVVPNWIR
jgi:TonB-dependent SusC/RagA subfamily outer membrane receptor